MSAEERRHHAALPTDDTGIRVALMKGEITPAEAAKRLGITEQDACAWYEKYAGRPYQPEDVVIETNNRFRPPCIPPDAMELDTVSFLKLVLPLDGWFASQRMKHGGSPSAIQWHDTHERICSTLLGLGEGYDAYFATASFHSDTGRIRSNAQHKRSLYVDLDVAGPADKENEHKYVTLAEAEAAVPSIIDQVGLPPTIHLHSGGGVHLYWALDGDLSTEEWQSLANELKQRLQDAGICFDVAVTTDAVRLMRLPGTRNQKPWLDKPLVRAWRVGNVISLEAIRHALAPRLRSRTKTTKRPKDSHSTNETYWQKTRAALLEQEDAAVLEWLEGLFSHTEIERWKDYASWLQILLACKPLADARESLYEPILDLLVRNSSRATNAASNVREDIEKHWNTASGYASLLDAMQEAERNGWTNTLQDAQGRFVSIEAFVNHLAAEHVYVKDLDAWICVSDGKLVSMHAVVMTEGPRAPLDGRGKPVGVGDILRNEPRIRRVKRLRYAPGYPLLFTDEDGHQVVNSYRFNPPPPLEPTAEELKLFNDVLDSVLPPGNADCEVFRDYWLNSLAWLVQDERHRLPYAMLLVGNYGSGKSTMMQTIPQLSLGKNNVGSVSQGELESPFNEWGAIVRLVTIEEMSMGSSRNSRRLANTLKPLISQDVMHVHPKGFKGYDQPNTLSIFATSNEEDAAYVDEGERRWLVCCSPSDRMSEELSRRFYSWLHGPRAEGVLRQIFLQRDISKFNPHAPLPLTASKREMMLRSKSIMEQALISRFDRYEAPFDQPAVLTRDCERALREEGFDENDISLPRIVMILKASPIKATCLPKKKRVQARGQSASTNSTMLQPVNVYVAKRDNPERWEGVPESTLRELRAKPWNTDTGPEPPPKM